VKAPPLNSTVLYRDALYKVRNGTRHKVKHTVTLWLCSDTTTTPLPAPLEEVTQIPQVGDKVCHYRDRVPSYTVLDVADNDGRCYLILQPENGEPLLAPLAAIDYYPMVGDKVLVAATPYCEWILEKARPLKKKSKADYQKYRDLMDSLDNLWWTSTIFTLRLVNSGGLAVLAGDGQRREAPMNCLRVYQKNKHGQKSLHDR
jgi:hypothetical protein